MAIATGDPTLSSFIEEEPLFIKEQLV